MDRGGRAGADFAHRQDVLVAARCFFNPLELSGEHVVARHALVSPTLFLSDRIAIDDRET